MCWMKNGVICTCQTHNTRYTPACTGDPVCSTALCSLEKTYNTTTDFIVKGWRKTLCSISVSQRITHSTTALFPLMLVIEWTLKFIICVCVCVCISCQVETDEEALTVCQVSAAPHGCAFYCKCVTYSSPQRGGCTNETMTHPRTHRLKTSPALWCVCVVWRRGGVFFGVISIHPLEVQGEINNSNKESSDPVIHIKRNTLSDSFYCCILNK